LNNSIARTSLAFNALPDASGATPTTYDAAGIANSKGKLTSISSSVSTYSYSGYDAMGRMSGAIQALGSRTYSFTRLASELSRVGCPGSLTNHLSYKGFRALVISHSFKQLLDMG
jgi:hypothetical protein